MTIGELAARYGVATHVLRHWESVGVLTPAGRVSGRRRYGPEHVARVATILFAKRAGLSLEQIRAVLDAPDPRTRRALLARHLADLDRRIREMEAAKELIEHPLHCPEEDFTTCPAFQELAGRIAQRLPEPADR